MKFIPKYLNEKQNAITQVVGTAVFAEVFILIFRPFDSGKWLENIGYLSFTPQEESWIYLAAATLTVLTAMGVIAVSRTMMYRYAKHHEISYLNYAFWILGELLSMALIYTTVVSVIGNHDIFGVLDIFTLTIGYTSCILLIPYATFLLYFSLKDKNMQLQKRIREEDEEKTHFNFKDERGELKLSVRTNALYYIEAADNYVLIHYFNSGKMQKFMFRYALKKIEDMYPQALVRCHRSYIVNPLNVKVLRKTEDGLVLDFGQEGLPNIPISKTYQHRVLDLIIDN